MPALPLPCSLVNPRFPFGFGRGGARGSQPPGPSLATVLVLATLQPLTAALQEALAELTAAAAEQLADQVARCGSAPVYRGDLASALELDRRLRAAGLTTSLNQLAVV